MLKLSLFYYGMKTTAYSIMQSFEYIDDVLEERKELNDYINRLAGRMGENRWNEGITCNLLGISAYGRSIHIP
ncbi:hypothetical protein D3C78_936940 [compost metagenome]